MKAPAIWFPAVRTGTGTDIFTENLVRELKNHGVRAEVTWLPHYAEYLPFIVPKPKPPAWANIVHVNSWLHHSFLPKNLPIVSTVHHAVHHPDYRQYKTKAQSLYHQYWIAPNERRVLHCSSRTIAVSQHVARATRDDLADIDMEIIYNGIDIQKFSVSKQSPKPRFRLIYVGTWTKRKGVDLLSPIMDALGPGFELLYTGGESTPDNPCMLNIGHIEQSELVEVLHNADLLLFPTRSEGLGLAILEALACGVPVVSTKIPPITELITEGANGFLCDINDTAQFAKKIKEISESTSLKATMRLNARASVETKFSKEEMTKRHIALYQSILSKLT